MTYGEAALTKQDTFWICSYVIDVIGGRDFNVLTPGERIFARASTLIGEVHNGGFDQYFFNGGVVYVHETAQAFGAIGAVHTQAIVRQAIRVAEVPEPLSADYDYYDHATEDIRKRLDELDRQFYDASLPEREVYPCLVKYLREHTEEFT